MNSASAYDYIQALYRVCLVQSGSATAAERTVQEIVVEAFKKANRDLAKIDFDSLFRTAFYRRNSYPQSSGDELADWPRRLHSLSEPHRSTLTLFYLEILPLSFIAEVADLTLEQLADTVRDARQALVEARK